MKIRVLGSAAGGGFPQWNCGCRNCRGVREGKLAARARTQESVAVSAGGDVWFLLNASPEIRAQLESFPALAPRAPRDFPVRGIVLTNGDLDHVLGLLSLRESYPLTVYATPSVRAGFCEGNVLYRTLQRFPEQVTWPALRLGEELRLDGGTDADSLWVTPFALPGKRPIHLEGRGPGSPEDNIGLVIRARPAARGGAGERFLVYAPAVAAWTPELEQRLTGAAAVLLDGTFWSSAELAERGVGDKRAEDMAHLPVGGPGGGLERLAGAPGLAPGARRVFIHINNTNPMLVEDSPEHRAVTAAGVELAVDGMELAL